jgi:elongator complex protein 2
LLTVGTDQTCRLWAPVPSNRCWVELARPQVHGYNLTAIACLSTATHPHLIATSGEEKEIRVFDAPKTTCNMLQAVCGVVSNDNSQEQENNRVERAFIPSLGLSNKASAADAAEEDAPSAGNYDAAVSAMRLPVERDLGAVSLWPEVQKLFGHNTEIYTLASNFESKTNPKHRDSMESEHVILASSTKAREAADAAIRLWDPINGKCRQVLSGVHTSTIASLAFSPDSQFLASTGKDRKLVVWKRNDQDDNMTYVLAGTKESAHKRIVWSVHFCPFDPFVLATGSRDGMVKIWRISAEAKLEMVSSFSPQYKKAGKSDAVTALAFAPLEMGGPNEALLALGLESGRLELCRVHLGTFQREMVSVPSDMCHIAAVTRMAWRPMTSNDDTTTLHLATCSADHSCRVFAIGPPVSTKDVPPVV